MINFWPFDKHERKEKILVGDIHSAYIETPQSTNNRFVQLAIGLCKSGGLCKARQKLNVTKRRNYFAQSGKGESMMNGRIVFVTGRDVENARTRSSDAESTGCIPV